MNKAVTTNIWVELTLEDLQKLNSGWPVYFEQSESNDEPTDKLFVSIKPPLKKEH